MLEMVFKTIKIDYKPIDKTKGGVLGTVKTFQLGHPGGHSIAVGVTPMQGRRR